MNKKPKPKLSSLAKALLAALLALLDPQFSTGFAQGALTPPGAPAPTMKTLDQIYARLDARIPLTNSSTTINITQPGSYYLTTNLTVPPGVAINIAASDVTLDLNGYTVSSSAIGAVATAIYLNHGWHNITLKNGFIQSGVTNDNGTYSGGGFFYGIYGTGLTNIVISGISVSGVLYDGIFLGTGDATVVEDCTVATAGSYGIEASTVRHSVALDCGGSAIFGEQVSDCQGVSSGNGYGIAAIVALNSYGSSTSGNGLAAQTVQNCYGFSTSLYGIIAITAQNSYGFSDGNGTAISTTTAENCYAYNNGTGSALYSYVAMNCYGYSDQGYGLEIAYSCIGSIGNSTYGTALYAYIANSCAAISVGGTAENITYKYNMP